MVTVRMPVAFLIGAIYVSASESRAEPVALLFLCGQQPGKGSESLRFAFPRRTEATAISEIPQIRRRDGRWKMLHLKK